MEVLELLMIRLIPADALGDLNGVTGMDTAVWLLTTLWSRVWTKRNLHPYLGGGVIGKNGREMIAGSEPRGSRTLPLF